MEHRTIIRLTGVLIFICAIATAFHSSQKRVETAIDEAFKEAIEQDYQHRKAYLTRHSSLPVQHTVKDYLLAPSADRKIKSYSVKTRKGLTTYSFKDSIREKNAKQLLTQYILESSLPLQPNRLKALFNENLHKKGIEGETGVLCIHHQKRQWSEGDSLVPANAYSTPRQTLDISGQLKVQAWMDYDHTTLFKNLDPVTYIFLLLIIGILVWMWTPTKKPEEETEATDTQEGIYIDMEKQELSIDGTLCTIAKLDLTLLQLLHERKGECLTREEIKQRFWPTDVNADEKIDTHIKTIRKTLKDFPHHQIVTIRGKGYYLRTTSQP